MSVIPRAVTAMIRRLPRLPGSDRLAGSWNQMCNAIEDADRQNAKIGQELAVPAVLLPAPDGSTWRVTVDNTGTLVTTQVPRT